MQADVAQHGDAVAADFRRAMAMLEVNAVAAPDVVLHLAAHMLADPRVKSDALAALSRALTAACDSTEPHALPGHAHAHSKRVAAILLLHSTRGDQR